jgi:spermidine synthase
MGRRALRGSISAPVASGRASLVPDPDLPAGWLLLVDETQQSHVDLDDPTHLVFEYVRRVGHVIDALPPGPLRAVHLGGGAMTLARYVSATRPRSRNLVVDNDAALVDLVRAHLPWPSTTRIRVRCADARQSLGLLPPGSADLIVLDVFASARSPGDVSTVEAFGLARRALATNGTLVANLADDNPLTYARRYVAGVRSVFEWVAACAEPAVLRGRRFGNVVVVARPDTGPPLRLDELARRFACDPWPARVLHGEALTAFAGDHRPFTDRTATDSPSPPWRFLG